MEKNKIRNALIITGASGSMGAAAVKAMAANGYDIIMACRNLEKAGQVRREIIKKQLPSARIYPLKLDLSEMSSVRSFVASVIELSQRENLQITGLFNNAGVINRRYSLTSDGLERTLATNYVGPYLLTRLLLPYLSQNAHIVNMVSLTCRYAAVDKDIFQKGEKSFRQLRTYADSKLALLLFSIALGRKLKDKGIHVNVSDPGVVNSNMLSMGRWYDPLADVIFRPFCKSPQKGAIPAIKALQTDSTLMYFKGNSHTPIPAVYASHVLIEWLWQKTEEVTGFTAIP